MPKPAVRILLLTLFTLTFSFVNSVSFAKDKNIVFNMTNTGYPPFMIHGSADTPPRGIIYDVFQAILAKQGLSMELAFIPKKRELRLMDQGVLDAHAIAREWVPNPGDYVFTDPILKIRNVLFSLAINPAPYAHVNDLLGKKRSPILASFIRP